jgi:RNA ligase
MNFFAYIGKTPQEFEDQYVSTGLVQRQKHAKFPLDIYSYARETVKLQQWDAVTSKCRGIIVNRDTGDVVARPFEKFHNHGSPMGTLPIAPENLFLMEQPVIWEKLDGFMCTLYTWEGVDYIASKGSFHSIHAKWATAWLRKKFGESLGVPEGYTAVFEGLHRDLRIVIDYKDRQELALLALINIETGEEYLPEQLKRFAGATGFSTPEQLRLTLEEARKESLDGGIVDEEGYVLTWYRTGQPPFRLKMKFIEYLRLHRMVTGVSPKHIWEVLSSGMTVDIQDYLNNSTPWFRDFVTKWKKALELEYQRISMSATMTYNRAQLAVDRKFPYGFRNLSELHDARKTFADEVTKPESVEYSAAAFGLLDGKDIRPIIWKQVKGMTRGSGPMVDAHT